MTVAIVLLVMMSAYFSATETAFSCLNKIRMKSRAESGDHRAALAMDLVEDYDRLISTILIGNNIVNITASTVGTVLFTKLYAAYGPTVSTVVLTLVVLIFGEISPKSLAKEHAESFAMFSAPILRVFLLVLRPLNFLFSQWKRLLNMIFHPSEDQGITEEELITMVSEAENEGGLDQHESQLIRSAIEFGDLEAGDILTPRVDIVAVEDSATMDEIAAAAGLARREVTAALESVVEPLSLDEPVYTDGGDAMYVIDQVRDPDSEESWISGLQFRDTVAALTPREKRIMELRYLRGKTQMEVAQEIGISQAQVSRLEKGALQQFHTGG